MQFVDYESGHRNRADVAARRAVLTGISQLTGKIAEHNMDELGTEYVEVTAHAGARPDHAVWQGKVYRWNKGKSIDNGGGNGIMNIEIDEFVPCLKDSKTGTILATEAKILPKSKYRRYTSANGWNIDWKNIPDNEEVYGVYLKDEAEPQGLIAIRRDRGGIFVSHISTAPQNNKQLNNGYQKYIGVGGHLFAIAVKESVKAGNKTGCVYGFAANEDVLSHYINKLGAIHFPIAHKFQFIIDGDAAQNIIDTYNFERG